MHPLWFYKHQHDNRFRSKLFVACQRWWFQWRFTVILVNCAPSGEMHNYCTPHFIIENCENFLIHRCNYILLSQVYCVWQVVKTPTIICNTPVYDRSISVYNSRFYIFRHFCVIFRKFYICTLLSLWNCNFNILHFKNLCNLVKHKCKTPSGWQRNVETCRTVYFIKRCCCNMILW